MTDNDYIAEYVRECHPHILGFDFAMWKCKRMVCDAMQKVADTLSQVDWGAVDWGAVDWGAVDCDDDDDDDDE